MWYNNKSVSYTHCKTPTKQAWAIISGLSGWKRIRTSSADGVTNVYQTLCQARANGRNVNVYVNGNYIEQVTML